MGSHFSKSRTILFLSFIAFIGLFISCSQNTPEISTTDYSVIFDYEGEDAIPSARLAIFASSASDVRRYERIRITSLDTGFCWEADNLARLESEEVQWAGCTNLVAPENEQLPTGQYEITYFNADEKECTVNMDVKYDVGLYEVLLSGLAEYMADKKGIEKIAVYNKEHILIYFGNKTEELQTTRDIWNKYRDAEYYQVIWYTNDGTVICIEPERPVVPETNEQN